MTAGKTRSIQRLRFEPGSNAACSRTPEPLASHNRIRINRIGTWEVRVADDLKIKVNGQISPVAASADTPLLYVLTNELKLWGPRRARAMRLLLGARRRGRD